MRIKEKLNITASTLYIIAMITMLIDHYGFAFFDSNVIMRGIGRISFPIFAFMLVEGYNKTSNKIKYFTRLVVLAIITEPIYDMAFRGVFIYEYSQNILFELSVGLIAIHAVNNIKELVSNYNTFKYVYNTLILGITLFIAYALKFDYGIHGLIMMIIFEIGYNTKIKNITTILGIVITFPLLYNVGTTIYTLSLCGSTILIHLQDLAILAIPILLLYNGQKGISDKQFQILKYVFYPLHLISIILVGG